MLSNFSQYSPQGLIPQFPGLQAAGLPQMSHGLFGQPGAYNGLYGPESVQAALSQQFPFGGQMGPFSQSPFATNPYLNSPWAQGNFGHNPLQNSFGGYASTNVSAQQIVPVLGQLAQQLAVQNAVTQQVGIAVHQLAHHLAQLGNQGYAGGVFGAPGGPALGPGLLGQGFSPQGLGNQGLGGQFGGYGGFAPQTQGWGGSQPWGANRSPTIQ